jgi:hypothetical protein
VFTISIVLLTFVACGRHSLSFSIKHFSTSIYYPICFLWLLFNSIFCRYPCDFCCSVSQSLFPYWASDYLMLCH